MGRELFTNAVPSTLNGTINSVTGTVIVTDASTWPTAAFRVVCEQEIMWCVSRTGNTLTCIRGYEGTTAAGHADTTKINHSVTAGLLNGFRLNTMADLGLISQATSLSADDDEFDDENFSGWTTVFQGSNDPTLTERNHRLSWMQPGGGANQLIRSVVKAKTPGAGDWVQAGFQCLTAYQYHMVGLVMSNGATWNAGRQASYACSLYENAFFLREFTGFNAWNTSVTANVGPGNPRVLLPTVHMRMVWNSTNNYTCMISPDAISWVTMNPGGTSAGTVGAITHMGFHNSTWGGPPQTVSVMYCRFSF